MDPDITTVSENHVLCPQTGFCTRCGSHIEAIHYENLLCMFSTKTTAISHLRAFRITQDKLKSIAGDLSTVS